MIAYCFCIFHCKLRLFSCDNLELDVCFYVIKNNIWHINF